MDSDYEKPMGSSGSGVDPDRNRARWKLWVVVFCAVALGLHVILALGIILTRGGIWRLGPYAFALVMISVIHIAGAVGSLFFRSAQSAQGRRRKLVPVGSICLAIGIWVLFVATGPIYRQYARRMWKERAIPEISSWVDDQAWVEREVALLKKDDWWLSEKMILMADGQWLLFENECNKSDWRIDDIFIAKGSDDKWYYSTCHFCVGMCVLTMMQDEQPPDLPFFIKRFHLREFDGKSDECLKKTKTFPDEL